MLILAGVSISDLSNNGGIINRTILATKEFKKQNLIEVVKTAEIYVEMDNQFDRTKQIDIVSLINKVKEISDINEKDYIITIDEVEQKATIIDKKMKIVIDVWIDKTGNVIVDGNIVENIEEIVAPTIEYTITPPAGTYGEEVTITIVAKEEKNGIAKTKFQNNAEKTYNNQKEVKETYTVTENGTYTYTAIGANGRKANVYIEIKNIMNGADITLVAQETQPTNKPVNVVITYDENIKIGGATLINADRFQYSIGGTTWQTATQNPITVPVSVNGNIYARYYDGTQGYRTTSLTITNIDKEAPNAFNLKTTQTTNSITVSAAGTVTDKGTTGCATGNIGITGYQFQLKDNAGTVLTSWTTKQTGTSYTFSNLTQGTTYKVSMRAIDKAGNMQEATNKDLAITLGTVADSSTKIGISYSTTNPTQGNVTVTFTDNSGVSGLTLKYQIGSTTGTWLEYTKPVEMTANGKIYARLFDNKEQYKNTATATIANIDREAPNAFNLETTQTTNSITVSAAGTVTDKGTTGCATGNIGITGYQFQLKDNAGTVLTPWTTKQTGTSYTFSNLTQGTTYKVSMRAIDKAGNMQEATNKDLAITLGTVADSSTKIGISYSTTNPTPGNVTVTFTDNSGVSGLILKYQIGSITGTWLEYTKPVEMTANGKIYARLFDNKEQYTNTATATVANIDKVVPVISSVTASTSWGATNSVTVKATDAGTAGCAAGNIGIVGYGINQSDTTEPTYTEITATTSLSTTINNITANGTYHVWVKDKAGNTANKAVTVNRVDTTAPTTATIASSNVDIETFTLTATGADGESGVARYEFYINNTLEKTVTTTAGSATYNVTGKTGSTNYTCYVKVYDAVGKAKQSDSITVTTNSAGIDIATDASIEVGDFVNYSVTVDGVTYDKWRILHKDTNGHVEIVCYNGPNYTLGEYGNVTKCKSDYANSIKILNDASAAYKNGTYGYSARHLGSNPTNPSSYATIPTSYVYFYSEGTITTERRAYLEQTHHETDTNALATFSGTNKLSGSYSWLASRAVFASSSDSYFHVRRVHSDGSVNSRYLCYMDLFGTEDTDRYSYALAPVVSLQSGIKAIPGSGDGSEGNSWELTL